MLKAEGMKSKDAETASKMATISGHLRTLQKEIKVELNERNAVENSSKECLIESLREVFKFS